MQESVPSLVSSAISKSPWFSSLTPDQLDQLTSMATSLRLAPGAVVFREGDPGDALFVRAHFSRSLVGALIGDLEMAVQQLTLQPIHA
jgi:hypothetical protein